MANVEHINLRQLSSLTRSENSDVAIDACLQLSHYYNINRNKQALTYSRKALEMAIKTNRPGFIARAHIQLATYFCRIAADYFTSVSHCDKALAYRASIENTRQLADVYKTYGVNYFYLGDFQKAQQSYRSALDILLNIKKPDYQENKDIADLYYNLAILNKSDETQELRKEYLEQALKFYQAINLQNGIARCTDGMAVYHFYTGNHATAMQLLTEALQKFKELKDTEGIFLTYNNLGTLKIQQGKFAEGIKYLKESLALRKKAGVPGSVARSLINIGDALMGKKQYREALKYLKEAEEILTRSKGRVELAALKFSIGKCYAALKNYQKAYEAASDYNLYREELHQYELQKAHSDSTLRHDIELMEKNALIDRLQNFEIASYIHRLEVSNEELRQFAHAASHDLKEPLRTINSFVNLLEKQYAKKIDATGHEYLAYISTATKRLEQLVKNILQLSKINLAESPLTEVDLNEVFEEVTQHAQALISERNAMVKVGKLPVIMADRSQMFQLFLNLVVNGIKYNKSKRPEVKVGAVRKNSIYRISVADNGIGIPAEYRDRIFEIFQRLHGREKYSGTGIGLTLCKKIVARHKGKIWVEENKPQGSVFYIHLPA